MNFAKLNLIRRDRFRGEMFHAVRLLHAIPDPMETAYSKDVASRYSPGKDAKILQYETLYLADDPVSALQEVEALYVAGGQLAHSWKEAWCVVPCRIELESVIDLFPEAHLDLLDTNITELTGNWRPPHSVRGEAPTQKLGEEIYQLKDVEAIVYPGAKAPYNKELRTNLIIFKDRLYPSSRLEYIDAEGNRRQIP